MDGFLDKAREHADGALDRTTLDERAQDAYAEHGDKVDGVLEQHGDRIGDGIDRAGQLADERTGGRFGEHIDTGTDRLREGLDSFGGDRTEGAAADPESTDGNA